MIAEIKIPEVGESITEGTLVAWLKKDGDWVDVDEEIYELETDKITLNVASEHSGKLKTAVGEGDTVNVGQIVATIDTEAAKPEGVEEEPEPETADETDDAIAERETVVETTVPPLNPTAGQAQTEAKLSAPIDSSKLSPAVRRLVSENNLDPRFIPGTGKDGRLTKADVIRFIDGDGKHIPHGPFSADPSVAVTPIIPPPTAEPDPVGRQTRTKMTRLRQRIAEHLVQAQQTAAILTTFNEVDMQNVMNIRRKFGEEFKNKYGIKLGMMSFFVKAAVEALKFVPTVNAQIDGDEIVQNHFYDIGVAVATEKGLVVPVIRDADKLSFAEVEMKIAEYAVKARERTLTLDDLNGGVFTVSNGGIFGSLVSTPILNYPQSAILGMHSIKKRPMVVEDDRIEVRPMMYLAVSYDHRLIDGHEAVTFLKRIVDCVEQPAAMLFEL